jgi:hypothetical protein
MAELMTLPDAIAELVSDGDSVALEGFTHLIPFAAGHEIIRQGRQDLELIRMTPDLLYDQMIGTRSSTTGRAPSRSRSTATPAWPTDTPPALPICLARCCAATSEPI